MHKPNPSHKAKLFVVKEAFVYLGQNIGNGLATHVACSRDWSLTKINLDQML